MHKTKVQRNTARRNFYEAAIASNTDACIFWPFGRNHHGYAEYQQSDGGSKIAHRRICEIANGPPPTPNHQAGHSCTKGWNGCINPKHLHWVTAKENHDESPARVGYVRLTTEQVREIRRRYVPKLYGYMRIAKELGVDSEAVRRVAIGVTYRKVV